MYLDPGFGGMLLQIVVVIIAMGGAILFSLRKKIRNLFTKKEDINSTIAPTHSTSVSEEDVIDVLDEDS
ncbi:MAG: hypothetical protein FWE05_01435 [Defluviitaleaceae bacterium]|nr:hypothetical protein [Defluviitaleaceae bacterium]